MRSNSYELDPDVYIPRSTETYCDRNTGKIPSALKFSEFTFTFYHFIQLTTYMYSQMAETLVAPNISSA